MSPRRRRRQQVPPSSGAASPHIVHTSAIFTEPVEAIPTPEIVPTEEDLDIALDEAWARRIRVQSFRVRGFTQGQIAAALQVSQSTISRDLVWLREYRKDVYGNPAKVEADQELGEALAVYQEIEMSAFKDYSRVQVTTHPSARARFLPCQPC